DVPVEIEREGLRVRRGAGRGLTSTAARGQAERQRAQGEERRKPNPPAHVRVTSRLSQVTTLRSISATSAKRTIAITDSSVIAANMRAVSRLLDAIRIWCPRPEPEPAHSANTAPITATAIAILVPLKKNGRAEGSSTRARICLRLAPSVRIIVISCGSTERSPSRVLTVTGKKQTSA